jgi:hyaluronan synthase
VVTLDADCNVHSVRGRHVLFLLERCCLHHRLGHTSWSVKVALPHCQSSSDTSHSPCGVEPNALDEMYTLLASSPNLAGVTADVKIWNRNDSFLALMCAIRYWFAFNVERACQSFWGCVSCISGPMGLYRTYDLDRILGPWSLQSLAGRRTTFGDDRHLTNQLLGLGLNTRYTHRTFCQSESPTQFVRWVKQQTRWSKSFFREAFWFPTSFAYHSFWLAVETTKQLLYLFILIATVLHFLYSPTMFSKPIAWLATMFGVVFIKSLCINHRA